MTALEPDIDAATAIETLLSPRSVAVVGSHSRPDKPGARTIRHLRDAGFAGELHATSDPADVPACDVAVIAVPAAMVRDTIRELRPRVEQFVVYSSGFDESGQPGLGDLALRRRLLGPNTVGYYAARSHAPVTFAQVFDRLTDCRVGPGVALVSHSGAFGARIVSAAERRGLYIDTFIAPGNEDGWDLADSISGLVSSDRHRPKVLLAYLESVADGKRLIAAIDDAKQRDVRVAVLVGGRSERAAAAARSHTAAVTPDSHVLAEVLRSLQVRVVDSDRDLVDAAIGLSTLPPIPHRPRVGIVSGSGGAGVVLTDLLADRGARVPEISPRLRSELRPALPDYASTENPVDVTASVIGDVDKVRACHQLLAESGEFDAIVMIGREEHADSIDCSGIPTVIALLDGDHATLRPYVERGAPIVGDLHAAASTIAILSAPYPDVDRRRIPISSPVHAAVGADSASSLRVAQGAGVHVAAWRHVHDIDGVNAAASELGWPVVLKANVPAAVHKRAVGAVVTDIGVDRVDEVAARLLRLGDGIIVAEQIRGGTEYFVGARADPDFGTVVSIGLGGSEIELVRRLIVAPGDLPPAALAERLADTVLPGAARQQLRRSLADNAVLLADIVASSSFITIECNPLVHVDDRLVALDARALTEEAPRDH